MSQSRPSRRQHCIAWQRHDLPSRFPALAGIVQCLELQEGCIQTSSNAETHRLREAEPWVSHLLGGRITPRTTLPATRCLVDRRRTASQPQPQPLFQTPSSNWLCFLPQNSTPPVCDATTDAGAAVVAVGVQASGAHKQHFSRSVCPAVLFVPACSAVCLSVCFV